MRASLCAVAALELLAAAAPARVISAELVVLGADPLLRRHRSASRDDPAGRHETALPAARGACRGDRVRSGKRLVLVGTAVAVESLRRLCKMYLLYFLDLY